MLLEMKQQIEYHSDRDRPQPLNSVQTTPFLVSDISLLPL